MQLDTWGAFSVTDHLGPRAFVADVLLYDKLVIPVPEGKERERWMQLGRQPEVLDRKLTILEEPVRRARRNRESLVERFAWTEEFRNYIDSAFPEARAMARKATTDRAWADSIDRGILAARMRSGDYSTPEIVPAYTSYSAMESDLMPVTIPADQVARPNDRLAGVIGWEFLVPDDPTQDDDSLLAEAVQLAQNKRFRDARGEFHSFRRSATSQGASPEQFRRRLESLILRYKEETARATRRTITLNAFAFMAASLSLAAAIAVPPVGIAAAAIGLVQVGANIGWRNPGSGQDNSTAAMFHDVRKHFGWHE
jgi:hypothetical protein